MCEVFLLRDLGPFELSVRGDVRGSGSALAVAAVLDHLPFGSDIVLDLRQIASLDLDAAGAIVRQLERRRNGDAVVVALADDPWIGRLLMGVGLDPSLLVSTAELDRMTVNQRFFRLAS
jgi:anti-anti-sigma regulatory factor